MVRLVLVYVVPVTDDVTVLYGPPFVSDRSTLYFVAPVTAFHVSVTERSPAVAVTFAGADSVEPVEATGVALTCDEFALSPPLFVATIT